jgi:hypothetical protein
MNSHALPWIFIPKFDFLAKPTNPDNEGKALDVADVLEPTE